MCSWITQCVENHPSFRNTRNGERRVCKATASFEGLAVAFNKCSKCSIRPAYHNGAPATWSAMNSANTSSIFPRMVVIHDMMPLLSSATAGLRSCNAQIPRVELVAAIASKAAQHRATTLALDLETRPQLGLVRGDFQGDVW